MSLLALGALFLACDTSDADGQIAQCTCIVSRSYGSDGDRAVVWVYDIDECAASGQSVRSGIEGQCVADFERYNSGFDDLDCACDCLYTDDGCYLSAEGASDTGWAR